MTSAKSFRAEGYATFHLEKISIADDPSLLLAQTAALGPSLALGELSGAISWLAIGIGHFGSSEGMLRFAVAARDSTGAERKAEILRNVLANNAAGIQFSEVSKGPLLVEGPSVPPALQWFSADHQFDIAGHIPRLEPQSVFPNALWMARFLAGLYGIGSLNAGIILVLRPVTDNQAGDRSVLRGLRSYFDTEPIHGQTWEQTYVDQLNETVQIEKLKEFQQLKELSEELASLEKRGWRRRVSAEKDWEERVKALSKISTKTPQAGDSHTRSRTHAQQLSSNDVAARQRERALAVLQELARSGAFWLSIRAVGGDSGIVRQVAALYWSCIANAGSTTRGSGSEYPRVLHIFQRHPKELTETGYTPWPAEGLPSLNLYTLMNPPTNGQSKKDVDVAVYEHLARHGIDLAFHYCGRTRFPIDRSQNAKTLQKIKSLQLKHASRVLADCERLVIPGEHEMLISGERLASVFQLPVDSNPAIEVLRGFSFCHHAPKPQPGVSALALGTYCNGALPRQTYKPAPTKENEQKNDRDKYTARLPLGNLTRHVLIVGATGCGKTTTVMAILAAIKSASRSVEPEKRKEPELVNVAILEGAKREYRDYNKVLNIKTESHYDLMKRFLEVNIFEHPQTISPEAHISQIAALFESTLALPQPVPIILREALLHAYLAYHRTQYRILRKLHPIRYWLLRSVLKVVKDCNYGGEIKQTIDGVLRTRLRALSMGACGQVLSGTLSWDELSQKLIGQSVLLEMESIADEGSRSLVMSLFVLYFRYALTTRTSPTSNDLRNVLVLEEAHRIIGKHAEPTSGTADTSSYFSNMLSEVRAYGCGIIISDQSPARLIDDAMRNTNTKLIMRLISGQDIKSAVEGAGLPAAALADIPKLRQFQGILISPDQLPTLVTINPLSRPDRKSMEMIEMSKAWETLAREESDASLLWDFLKADTAQPGTPAALAALRDKGIDLVKEFQDARKEVGCTESTCKNVVEVVNSTGEVVVSTPGQRTAWCKEHFSNTLHVALALRLTAVGGLGGSGLTT